jgi:DNA mismatch repair protein MutS
VALTPMMQQYLLVKEKCKDCILFFRLGDFYEMFFDDAEVASRELELVLTGRDCGLEERAPMCGIPYHAANNYITRLVNRGYKIAICEQMEDPAVAKGIVKRDIIRVVTPGTYIDSAFLDETRNNYIMSIYTDDKTFKCALCFADISTGEFYATCFHKNTNIILDEISKFYPKEILIQSNLDKEIIDTINERFSSAFTVRDSEYFDFNNCIDLATTFNEVNSDEYDVSVMNAASGILNYVLETQKISLSNINKFDYYDITDYMSIDINSRKNLELTENMRDRSKKASLLWVIDKTNTAMGSRLLRKWVEQPLLNKKDIEERLNAVEEIKNSIFILEDLKEALKGIYDIERIAGKVSSKSVNAKELISLKLSISRVPKVKELLSNFNGNLVKYIFTNLDELKDIYDLVESSIQPSPALSVKEGNIIKDGFNDEIDNLRKAKMHGKEWIASLENSEREITGIKSLKVGYNKVFGYYIEISKANYTSIPSGRYIRKQTLSNAERFITEELKEMEEKILGAEEKLISLEYDIFIKIRDTVEGNIERLKRCASLLSQLDCLCSLAVAALENNYVKPIINNKGYINIQEGRHPVIEKMLQNGSFVSNSVTLDNEESQLLIITGPNMAGKSTYMRQVALTVILAQIGSFVPASSADISICDRVFTRIGASDDLSSGKSTFMVEMWEVANILNNATNKSLILLDEVGRGTSTYDGLSIAWSVIEYICNNSKLRCKTLFATHYHELTKLEGMLPGVKNYCVSVKEIGNEIVFLRKIIKGGADQSYGIEVAKLAGLPESIIQRAKEILEELEGEKANEVTSESAVTLNENCNKIETCDHIMSSSEKNSVRERKINKKMGKENDIVQIDFSDLERRSLLNEISLIDIMNMTPMESMNKLYDIIKKAKGLN